MNGSMVITPELKTSEKQLVKTLNDLHGELNKGIDRVDQFTSRIEHLGTLLCGNRLESTAPCGADTPCSPGCVGALTDARDRLNTALANLDDALGWLEG